MNPESSKFIKEVLSCIKDKKIHTSIAVELEDHIECLKEYYTQEGFNEHQAYEKAISDMGEAAQVGKLLNKMHRPRMAWSVLLLMMGIIGIGLIALQVAECYNLYEYHRLFKQIEANVLGIVVLVSVYLLDYRYLEKWAVVGYIAGIGLLLWGQHGGIRVNGIQRWIEIGPITLDSVALAMPILMISCIGIVHRLNFKRIKDFMITGLMMITPLLLLMKISFMRASILGICLVVVLNFYIGDEKFKDKRMRLWAIMYGILGGGVAAVSLILYRQPYRVEQLKVFRHPELDPLGAGYQAMQMKIIRENAALIGGENFRAHSIKNLPAPTDDVIFTFIVGSMGWLVGIVLIGMVILIMISMIKATMQIKESYGRLINISITTLLTVQFLYNIGMNLGLLPLTGVPLPFISYGGTNMIVNMALIGIFLSIYRKKDVILLEKVLLER